MSELEILEKYELLGETRFRVRIKGTKIVLNVRAKNKEEALEEAKKMMERVKLNEVLKEYIVES